MVTRKDGVGLNKLQDKPMKNIRINRGITPSGRHAGEIIMKEIENCRLKDERNVGEVIDDN